MSGSKVKELFPFFVDYCNQKLLKYQLIEQLKNNQSIMKEEASKKILKEQIKSNENDLKEFPIKKQKLSLNSINLTQQHTQLAQNNDCQHNRKEIREQVENQKQNLQTIITKQPEKPENNENNRTQNRKILLIQNAQHHNQDNQLNQKIQNKSLVDEIITTIKQKNKQLKQKIISSEQINQQELPQIGANISENQQLQIPQLPTIRKNKSFQKNKFLEKILQTDVDEQVEEKMMRLNQIFTKLQENEVQDELKSLNKESIIILFSKIQALVQIFLDLYNSNQITKMPLDIYGLYILYKHLKQNQGFIEQLKDCKQSIVKLCKIYEDYIPEKILDVEKQGKAYIFKVK